MAEVIQMDLDDVPQHMQEAMQSPRIAMDDEPERNDSESSVVDVPTNYNQVAANVVPSIQDQLHVSNNGVSITPLTDLVKKSLAGKPPKHKKSSGSGGTVSKRKIKDINKDPETIAKEVNLRIKINKYLNSPRFGPYLTKLGFSKKQKIELLDLDDLVLMHGKITEAIDDKFADGSIPSIYFGTIDVLERATHASNINKVIDLDGVGDALHACEPVQECLEQLSIENGNVTKMDVSRRLMVTTVLAGLQISTMNKKRKAMSTANINGPCSFRTTPPMVPASIAPIQSSTSTSELPVVYTHTSTIDHNINNIIGTNLGTELEQKSSCAN